MNLKLKNTNSNINRIRVEKRIREELFRKKCCDSFHEFGLKYSTLNQRRTYGGVNGGQLDPHMTIELADFSRNWEI